MSSMQKKDQYESLGFDYMLDEHLPYSCMITRCNTPIRFL